ncbi:MAG: iron-sulfur cluster assembly accessory protein [Cytophagales bacterium]
MNLPIEITDRAYLEILNIFKNKNIPQNYSLRVGVRGSGCSGVSQYLGFDQKNERDEVYSLGEIEVLIEKKDFMHLIGMKIDFVSNEEASGFVFL